MKFLISKKGKSETSTYDAAGDDLDRLLRRQAVCARRENPHEVLRASEANNGERRGFQEENRYPREEESGYLAPPRLSLLVRGEGLHVIGMLSSRLRHEGPELGVGEGP